MDSKKQTEPWQNRLSRSINSAICFALAYVLITYLFWLVTGLTGRVFKFDSFVYCYGIKFILNNNSWNKMNVTLVYAAGPVFSLCIGLSCYFLYKTLRKLKTAFNIFLLWCFVIGTGIFIAQALIATLGIYNYTSQSLYQGFAVVLSWLGVPVFLIYLFNLPFLILALYFAVTCVKPFLLFASSYRKVNSLSRRKRYFFEIAIAPFVIGVFMAAATTLPKSSAGSYVFRLMLSTNMLYLVVIAGVLGAAWVSLPYIELLKPEVVRKKELDSLNIFFVTLLLLAAAYIYVTYQGTYLSAM